MEIGTLTGSLELDDHLTSSLELATEKVKKFAEEFEHEFEGLTLVVGVLALAVVGVTATIVELGEKGSEINDVKESFDRLAGGAEKADEILKSLSSGVVGTIDDLQLMTQANKLLQSGVKLTADQFGNLASAARVLSREGFGPMPEILAQINRGMETGVLKGPLLKSLHVDLAAAEQKLATSLGLTSSELTKSQKLYADRQALLQATTRIVQQAGTQELSFKEIIDQGKTAIENWGLKLASSVAASPHVMDALNAIGKALTDNFGGAGQTAIEVITGWVNKFADAVGYYGPIVIRWIKDVIDKVEGIYAKVTAYWDTVPQWFKNIAKEAAVAGVATLAFQKGVEAATGESTLSMLANVAQIWGTIEKNVIAATKAVKEFGLLGALGNLLGNKLGVAGVTAAGAAVGFAYVDGLMGSILGPKGLGGLQSDIAIALSGSKRPSVEYSIDVHGGGGEKPSLGLPPPSEINAVSAAVQALIDKFSGADVAKKLRDISAALAAVGGASHVTKFELDALGKELDTLWHEGGKLTVQQEQIRVGWMAANTALDPFLKSLPNYVYQVKAAGDAELAHSAEVEKMRVAMIKGADAFSVLGNLGKTTWDTLGDAATKAGYSTRVQLQQSADSAKKLYDDMLASGRYSAAQLATAWQDYNQKQTKVWLDQHLNWQMVQADLIAIGEGLQNLGQSMSGELGGLIAEAGKFVSLWAGIREEIVKAGEAGVTTAQRINATMAAIASIAGVISATGAGSAAARIGGGALQGASAGAGLALALGATSAATLGISAAVGALAGAIYGWVQASKAAEAAQRSLDVQLEKVHKTVNETYGSFEQASALAARFGLALADATGSTGHHSAEDIQRMNDQLAALDETLKKVAADVQRYGLTWADMNQADATSAAKKASDELLASYTRLTQAGYSSASIVRGMSGDLNAWIANALQAGVRIPAAMGPIIESLIRSGQLTEANARAMLGLAADTMPSLQDITDAANRYGLSLDQLGPKVKQLQITEAANQIVKDFNLLTMAGASLDQIMQDTGTAADGTIVHFDMFSSAAEKAFVEAGGSITGMHHAIQDMVLQSIGPLGIQLPAAMKPIIQSLITAGGLVDATGNKITDIGQIQFAPDLPGAIEDLVDALHHLMDAMNGPTNSVTDSLTGQKGIAAAAKDAFATVEGAALHAKSVLDGIVFTIDYVTPDGSRGVFGHGPMPTLPTGPSTPMPPGTPQPTGGNSNGANINIVAWDGKSVRDWLDNGGDVIMAKSLVKTAKDYGLTVVG